MSTSSLNSHSSYSALSTAKKTPKRFVKDPEEPDKKKLIQKQLDSMKLELDTMKINIQANEEMRTKNYVDNWMDTIDCDKLLATIDSVQKGLSSKLDIVRQLSLVPREKPSLVVNDDALTKASEKLDKAICILENLRID